MKTIFFDLDGTLLPMDQDAVIGAYLSGMVAKMAGYGYDPKLLMKSIYTGIAAMTKNNGSVSNEEVFWSACIQTYGKDVRQDEPLFIEYYKTEFQELKAACGRSPMAAALIQELKDRGYQIILATNPLFPAIATQSRIRWAGLEPEDFVWVTTYENSSYCKPNPDYYREILDKLDLRPEDCLMVGNDAEEDMAAKAAGMEVFLLTDCLINKKQDDIQKYPHGSFPELQEYIWSLGI